MGVKWASVEYFYYLLISLYIQPELSVQNLF